MYDNLVFKLDALSNYRFKPKLPKLDSTIKTNVPAISIEEVAPVTASESNVLAPEEIYQKKKSIVKGETEITSQEKKRARVDRKKKGKIEKKEAEINQKIQEKLFPGKSKVSRKTALKNIKTDKRVEIGATSSDVVKTSSKLFQQLQQEAQMSISDLKEKNNAKKKTVKLPLSKNLKL